MSEKLERVKRKWTAFQDWRALHPGSATVVDLAIGFVVGFASGAFWV